MLTNFINATYIAAGLMFILALAGLSKHETARKGNVFGIMGMVFAVVATSSTVTPVPCAARVRRVTRVGIFTTGKSPTPTIWRAEATEKSCACGSSARPCVKEVMVVTRRNVVISISPAPVKSAAAREPPAPVASTSFVPAVTFAGALRSGTARLERANFHGRVEGDLSPTLPASIDAAAAQTLLQDIRRELEHGEMSVQERVRFHAETLKQDRKSVV